MTGKGRRVKGHSFERHVAKLLADLYPEVKRHLESQRQEALGYDLDNTGPFRLQCKKGTHVPRTIYNFYKQILPKLQTKEVKEQGIIRAVVMARDFEEALVTLSISDFIYILKQMK